MDYTKTQEEFDKWYDQANQLKNSIQGLEFYPYTISIHPAWKGSNRVGYSWKGNFKVVVSPKSWGVNEAQAYSSESKRFYVKTLEELNKKLEKLYVHFHNLSAVHKLIAWYRKTNLIPKRTARSHARFMKEIGIDYKTPEGNKQAWRFLGLYLSTKVKCPNCKKRGMIEQLSGWGCKNECGFEVNDIEGETIELCFPKKDKV
jgi:hypothetical protein